MMTLDYLKTQNKKRGEFMLSLYVLYIIDTMYVTLNVFIYQIENQTVASIGQN